MNRALEHSYPQWEPPEDDPSAPQDEWREVWYGRMRIVHARRARKLRRRGVPLMFLSPGKYAWFETEESYETRRIRRKVYALLRQGPPLRYDAAGYARLRRALAGLSCIHDEIVIEHNNEQEAIAMMEALRAVVIGVRLPQGMYTPTLTGFCHGELCPRQISLTRGTDT